MTIISLKFLLFVTITLFVYYLVPGRFQWGVLLAASIVFYLCAGTGYLLFAAVLILASYFAARLLSSFYERQKTECSALTKSEQKQCKTVWKRKRRRVLISALAVVIGILAFLKSYHVLIGGLNFFAGFLGLQKVPSFSLLLPLGLSFYSFQIVAYLADVYRGKCEAQKSLARYALFVLFFPQITEGPIARYDRLAPQLFAPRKLSYENLKFGAQLMLWGFFKKLVIADRLGLLVNHVFENDSQYSGLVLVLALVFYSVQIYADFSGCIDIVTGASEMFGIKLDRNFNHPYFSKTVPEFWRRWHMSLSSWFKDYVFYPVSASKLSLKLNKSARHTLGHAAGRVVASSFPVLVVWILTGLWHGVQWNYVAWGLYYGVLIILSILFAPYGRKLTAALHIPTESFGWRLFQMVRTFSLCTFARVFSRAKDFSDALSILSRMFGGWPSSVNLFSLGLDRQDFAAAVGSVLLLLVVSNLQEHVDIRKTLSEKNVILRWGVYYAAIFLVLICGVYGSSNTGTAFLYEKY